MNLENKISNSYTPHTEKHITKQRHLDFFRKSPSEQDSSVNITECTQVFHSLYLLSSSFRRVLLETCSFFLHYNTVAEVRTCKFLQNSRGFVYNCQCPIGLGADCFHKLTSNFLSFHSLHFSKLNNNLILKMLRFYGLFKTMLKRSTQG